MADTPSKVGVFTPKSKNLPKGMFRQALPESAVAIVVSVDGVPEFMGILKSRDDDFAKQMLRLKGTYTEVVGEDAGHYAACTAHVLENQTDGAIQVGNAVLLWEDGVRALTRATFDEKLAAKPKPKATAAKTRKKPTARKPVAGKTPTRAASDARKAKAATARPKPKATAKKRTVATPKPAVRKRGYAEGKRPAGYRKTPVVRKKK